ncbi:MAG TPA: M23 family metallopeptidase [Candidatus Limnocylindrales bacterium]|jgi:murein DD-endopeptidase MepM/ murein hydrolase activator NlpD|nr:M23 family metallopeptidase [Candidatus Limnocylindrales bacterium]
MPSRGFRGRRLAMLGLSLVVLLAASLVGGGLLLVGRPLPTPSPAAIGGPSVEVTAPPSPTTEASTPPPTAAPKPSPPTPEPSPEGPISLPPEKLRGFVWPLRNARISSSYGPRDDGNIIISGERYHDGIDLATWCGDKIRAAHSGTVLYQGRKFDEFGGYSGALDAFYARLNRIGGLKLIPIVVVIDYGNGYRGLYAHLSKAIVEAGDVVEAGQVIGYEGATGRATGCHLHYALIRMDGAWLEVAPNLVANLSYPPFVRERVDPLLVFPLNSEFAPRRFQLQRTLPPRPIPPEPGFGGMGRDP